MTSLMAFIRRYVLLFGVVKFCAGLVIGFGLGVYFLPILTAEKGLDTAAIEALSQSALRQGTFVRDLPGSDGLHWGLGDSLISVTLIKKPPTPQNFIWKRYRTTVTSPLIVNTLPLSNTNVYMYTNTPLFTSTPLCCPFHSLCPSNTFAPHLSYTCSS